jgi:thioredoxin 1
MVKMAEWEDMLPPLMKEKLAKVGEASLEEKERMKELGNLNALLTDFFQGSLSSESLYQRFKEYEAQGKQFLLKEAQVKLRDSFKKKELQIKFRGRDDGRLTVEFVEGEELQEEEEDLVLELTPDNFDEAIKKHAVLVVDCWAPWCAPCRMVAPVIEGLAEDYQGKIAFGKLNVDVNQTLAMRYQIMSIPTLLIFKNGQLVDQKVGALPRNVLEPELIKYIEEDTPPG